MRDAVQDNLPCGRLRPFDCGLAGVASQESVQLWHLDDPTTVDFAIKLNRRLHSYSLELAARWDRATLLATHHRVAKGMGFETNAKVVCCGALDGTSRVGEPRFACFFKD